jgi:type III restriction enzyme
MELKFDGNLDYQIEAINSIVSLFKGQNYIHFSKFESGYNGIISNELNISESKLLENLNGIQKNNNLKISNELKGMDFSIEMETGTGKTYVYLRTIFELNKEYGFKKYIIVVPSVAIKEGVLKTLEITKQHFKQMFDNVSYNYREYDSSKINIIRQFARNNNIEILVMTLDSFNKDSNVIKKNRDQLAGEIPIEFIKKVNPILILDEPQNMESEISKKALSDLNPLFKLRYSATHKDYYNLVYRLSPVDAYNKGLVKKIEVSSVIKENDFNNVYIKCLDITADSKGIKAKIKLNKKQKKGYSLKEIIVKQGDDLFKKSENPEYSGFVVSGLDVRYNVIKFSNGVSVKKGEELGGNREELMRIQIRQTIEEHMYKQETLKKYNIKVLSLFFIDKVPNYLEKEGIIRKMFIEEFDSIKTKFSDYKNKDVSKVHNGYFSKTGKTDRSIENDKEAYDLIMKNKEKLLSFEEDTAFIFSHSALREGWDNPNVFNICTLNETYSEMKKRQEIGRGMRLPVDQNGNRITDLEHNTLTVIANQSYEDYVSHLQIEYIDEGIDSSKQILPKNAHKRKTVVLKKGFNLNPDFKELWERISKRTKYDVDINSEKLVENCAKKINELHIDPIKINVQKVSISMDEKGVQSQFIGSEDEKIKTNFEIPNVLDLIAKETGLTRITIFDILSNVKNLNLIFDNPQDYIEKVSLIIKHELNDLLLDGIKYVELNDYWKMELFKEIETYENKMIADVNNKSIYESIVFDSDGEEEFAKKLENDTSVKLFVKLPRWFIVETPVGEYNPDWAVVYEERDLQGKITEKLYLVRETKFADLNNLRYNEEYKIKCAKKHFKTIEVDYKEIDKYDDLIK